MSNRSLIIDEIQHVATAHNKKLAPLNDDTSLLNMGLDSLCFAILVSVLEEKTGIDPFSETDETAFPVTLGDLIRAYDRVRA